MADRNAKISNTANRSGNILFDSYQFQTDSPSETDSLTETDSPSETNL